MGMKSTPKPARECDRTSRRPYRAPRLESFGTTIEITQAGGQCTPLDGALAPGNNDCPS
jgi:hypothetical protein